MEGTRNRKNPKDTSCKEYRQLQPNKIVGYTRVTREEELPGLGAPGSFGEDLPAL